MMSTQSKSEHGVIQSSIGLLQERFRQLQRMKEMRENKQLLRMFSDYNHTNATSIILSTTNNYYTTTAGTSTSTSDVNIKDNNNNNNNMDASSMQNNDDDDEEELQIFIPPNYMSNKNRKVSCYSSPSSSSTISLSSSSSSSSQNNHKINLNDVSLSLWPPTPHNNSVATDHFGRTKTEEVVNRPTTSVSTAFKLEDSHHFSDVDTTLHL